GRSVLYLAAGPGAGPGHRYRRDADPAQPAQADRRATAGRVHPRPDRLRGDASAADPPVPGARAPGRPRRHVLTIILRARSSGPDPQGPILRARSSGPGGSHVRYESGLSWRSGAMKPGVQYVLRFVPAPLELGSWNTGTLARAA